MNPMKNFVLNVREVLSIICADSMSKFNLCNTISSSLCHVLSIHIKNLVVFMFAKILSSIYEELKIRKLLNSEITYFPCKKTNYLTDFYAKNGIGKDFSCRKIQNFFSTFFMKRAP